MIEPMDLAELLRDACEEGRMQADAASLRFTSEQPPTCAMVGDPERLRRLFVILLDNAVNYTPTPGAVSVTMCVQHALVDVEIRDTGVGIVADDLVHIFERFSRVAVDRSRTTGGVGLGLSIGQWIAISHDGRIRAESEYGVGSVLHDAAPHRSRIKRTSGILQNLLSCSGASTPRRQRRPAAARGAGRAREGHRRTVYSSVFGKGKEVAFPADMPIQLQLAPGAK